MTEYCCSTMKYMVERKDENAPVKLWDDYFSISYRDKKGNRHGAYQGQYCMWCGEDLRSEYSKFLEMQDNLD